MNILRNYRVNPDFSAYAYLYGPYDFNKYTMAPPETCVMVHDKPGNFSSWVYHGTPGWYIGPSIYHYICMQCYMPTTDIVRITDTLQYILKEFALPKTTKEDYLQQAIGEIIAIMKDSPKTLPYLYYFDEKK